MVAFYWSGININLGHVFCVYSFRWDEVKLLWLCNSLQRAALLVIIDICSTYHDAPDLCSRIGSRVIMQYDRRCVIRYLKVNKERNRQNLKVCNVTRVHSWYMSSHAMLLRCQWKRVNEKQIWSDSLEYFLSNQNATSFLSFIELTDNQQILNYAESYAIALKDIIHSFSFFRDSIKLYLLCCTTRLHLWNLWPKC